VSIESANLKLIRATEHLKIVYAKGGAYPYTQSDVLINESNDEKTFIELAVIIGEFLYQLRSILDHLAFDLVELNVSRIQLPRKWREHCQFPLIEKIPTTGNPAVPRTGIDLYKAIAKNLPGIPQNALTFIECVQPYHRTDRIPALRLWWIKELSNIDKHRHLHLIRRKNIRIDLVRENDGGIYAQRSVLDGNTKFGGSSTTDKNSVNVKSGLFPIITLDEPILGDASTLPLHELMQACHDTISGHIIPAFAQFLNQP